jgi:hypothetical protein
MLPYLILLIAPLVLFHEETPADEGLATNVRISLIRTPLALPVDDTLVSIVGNSASSTL